MRFVLALTLVAGLLASCDFGWKSEADKLHDLQVACLTGGGVWNTSTSACNGHAQATPNTRPSRNSPAPPTRTPTLEAPATLIPQPTAKPWPSAPDRLAFMSRRDGDWDIYVMDADGGNLQQLTDNPGFDANPAWSPGGTQIMPSSSFSSRAAGAAAAMH